MPFPVAKLGYLAIKQISKPLANVIKNKAKDSPFLRNTILMKPAQFYHRVETSFRMRLLGLAGKSKSVKPLESEAAVELGAEMLGEIVVFSVGAAIIYAEFWRQARKEQGKEDVQNNRLKELEQRISNLGISLEQQSTQIRELTRLLYSKDLANQDLPSKIQDSKTGTVLKVEKS